MSPSLSIVREVFTEGKTMNNVKVAFRKKKREIDMNVHKEVILNPYIFFLGAILYFVIAFFIYSICILFLVTMDDTHLVFYVVLVMFFMIFV